MKASIPANEAGRLRALRDYAVLDTPPEADFDDIVELVAQLCQVPMALITLVDERRQWFKAKVGTSLQETPREVAFCAHALDRGNRPLVVTDATKDDRFADNPFVNAEPGIRFYAGAPLVSPGGFAIGTLCVIDTVPRELTPEQVRALSVLSRHVMTQLQLRRLFEDQKRVERALQESEERWQFALEGSEQGVWDWNLQNDAVFFSDRWCRMLGHEPAEIPRALESWSSRVHPDDLPSTLALIREHLEGRTPCYVSEHRMRAKDGGYRWILDRGKILTRSPDGRPLRMVGTHTDITERRRTEEALRESRADLARAQEIAHLGSWARDVATGTLRWSEETFRIFGLAPGVACPTYEDFLAAVHPEDREVLRSSQRVAWEEGARLDVEHRIVRPEGSIRWVHQLGEIERDGEGRPVRVTGTTLDITDRKATELALKESEQRFELAVRGTTAGIWDWNLRTDEVYHSPRHQEMLGYRPGEFVKTAAHFLEQIHPADVERVKEALNAHLSEERRPYQVEFRIRNKSGEYRWCHTTGQAEFDKDGAALRMVGATTDITERKQLEEQFLRVQRMESLGTLAGGIAHDLNNLLAPILMGVGLLKSNDLNPQGRQVLANIERSALRGAELVKQVLSFARGVEGARVAVPMDQVVREIETIVRNTFPKNIRLVTQVDSRLGMVLGDPLQLNQALLNLCVNARDAMAAGGTLTLKVANATIDEPFAAMSGDVTPGHYVLINVTDTGEGIDGETLKRLFEPFFTTKTVGKGSGLGLSTTLGIVRSHGGFVHVQSEAGRGANFRLYLPAQPEEEMTMPAPEEVAELPRGRGELILVVDDERSILEVVRETLESCGYRVLTAEDGAQAVGVYALNRKEVVAVITDMMMPVMDGAALIGALRRLDPDIPIIAASGLISAGSLPGAIAGQVRLLLAKPYSASSLLIALDELIATAPKRGAG